MGNPFPLRLFDAGEEVSIVERHLPHFAQHRTLCFITFRLNDSMPRDILDRWRRDRLRWLRLHDIDPNDENWRQQLSKLDAGIRDAFHRLFAERWHDELDRGHGKCELRRPEFGQIVADSSLFFDASTVDCGRGSPSDEISVARASHLESDGHCGDHFPSDQPVPPNPTREVRYCLTDFVVMPNHVHLLAAFKDGTQMLAQCESWKRFTARKINARLKTKGRFWQPDAFDHLVRSEEQFRFLRRYIADNPIRAKLGNGEFVYWSRALPGDLRDA